ncbi:hypothetical protein GWN65_01955, partial [Candidatus Bathyarchaeota archaeon]|nr:hypothetical protein [Candidatus Bathyarchaeota archaeon]NIV43765.1 hypothetical protein [Candidatus Bathyarchaeota archaeon]
TSVEDGIPKDLRKRRISLPLIHLYKSTEAGEREALLEDLRVLARKDRGDRKIALDRILQNLKTTGSLEYCTKKIDEYVAQSIGDIHFLRDTNFKFYLIQMARSLQPA